jgi:hypothetical protein
MVPLWFLRCQQSSTRSCPQIVSEYTAETYAVPKRADLYGDADEGLAVYPVEPHRGVVDKDAERSETEVEVWAIPNNERLHLLLPKD